MRLSEFLKCADFPCQDANKECYIIPNVEVEAGKISVLMVSEAPSKDLRNYFYSLKSSFYAQTTVQAFNDAGLNVFSIEDVLGLGVYVTAAVKCGKIVIFYPITIFNCSFRILENEISLFPKTKAILLIGDTSIRAMNCIIKRNVGKTIIPSDSTYKIRKTKYFFKDLRVFPLYLQTGKKLSN